MALLSAAIEESALVGGVTEQIITISCIFRSGLSLSNQQRRQKPPPPRPQQYYAARQTRSRPWPSVSRMGQSPLSYICCTLPALVCFLLCAIPSTATGFISDLNVSIRYPKRTLLIPLLSSSSGEDHVSLLCILSRTAQMHTQAEDS